jgi:cyclophilin family peptidyl-prolyl cis-trans isomerase
MKPGTYANFETSLGNFTIELFEQLAPNTVGNFLKLAESDFYNGVIFHRVIDGFMIQGGDPTGTGRGGPGYQFADEFHPKLKHDSAGILSMANAGPNTNGSQFFITLAPTPHLDGRHSVFGKVTEGIDIVRAIGKTQTKAGDRPVTDVVMKKVAIQRVAGT